MFKYSPVITMYFLIVSILLLGFFLMLSGAGLMTFPILLFKVYAIVFGVIFFWWPIDMLINWEKRSDTANKKDRLLICISLSTILFVFPYFFAGTPFYPTLFTALGIGFFFPGLIVFIGTISFRQPVISPGLVHKTAMATTKAELFSKRFPNARQFILGYTGGTNKQAKLLLHERINYDRFDGAQIDYVLSIPIDRKTGVCIEGIEKLECYLFINDEGKAGVAFLPSTNFGRALDYGFSDDEIDGAVEEAKKFKQVWPSIDYEPLTVQLYSGKYVRMK